MEDRQILKCFKDLYFPVQSLFRLFIRTLAPSPIYGFVLLSFAAGDIGL